MEEQRRRAAELEALLFTHGEPLGTERIAALLEVSQGEAREVVEALAADLESRGGGLALLRAGESVQLVTHPRTAARVAELLREEMSQDLGAAAVETLALVAYFGPVARSVVDHVRGVSSAVSLRTLMVRGLIERTRTGRGEHLYELTPALVRELGLTDRRELPDFAELSQLLERALASREHESPPAQAEA